MAKVTVFEVGYCTHIGCMALRGGFRVCKFPARAYLLEVGSAAGCGIPATRVIFSSTRSRGCSACIAG